MGSDAPAEQRLQGFEPLRCCGRGVLIAVTSLGQQKGLTLRWFEPAQRQPTVTGRRPKRFDMRGS